MIKNIKHIKFLLLLILPTIFAGISINNVHADIMDTIKIQNFYNCYQWGRLQNEVDVGSAGVSISKIVNDAVANGNITGQQDNADDLILPTNTEDGKKYGHNIGDSTLKCSEFLGGYNKNGETWAAVVSGMGDMSSPAAAAAVLQKLGYENTDADSETPHCIQYNYQLKGSSSPDDKINGPRICVTGVNEDGSFNNPKVKDPKGGEEAKVYANKAGDNAIQICDDAMGNPYRHCRKVEATGTWEDFKTNVYNAMSAVRNWVEIQEPNPGYAVPIIKHYDLSNADTDTGRDESSGEGMGKWTLKSNAVDVALKENFNWTYQGGGYKFTVSQEDKSHLHKWYFTNFYKASLFCEGEDGYEVSTNTDNYIKLDDLGRKVDGKSCVVKVDAKLRNKSVMGVSPDMTWYKEYKSLDELISAMSDDDLLTAASVTDPGNSTGEQTGEDSETDPCATADLFGMGWLLCSSLKNGTQTLDPLEGMIQQMLAVNPTLYGMYYKGTKNETATYQAWKIIRGVANFLMIIIFLVVIFSQITGHGIDNYGIKKILPKLILGAILINLSFIICELIVDLSNILGQGLDSLFYSIAEGIETSSGSQYNALTMWTMTGIVNGFLGGLAAGGVISGVGGLVLDFVGIDSAGTLVVILLLAVAVILISLLIFFASLGARMIIIVVCVTVSPVAFALYILPNTQKLFQKWWKLFESALIIYPICGALYGISQLIRVIIFSTGNEAFVWEGIIAVIAPYIPFFAIPLLLKSAISALGVAGAALTNIGNGLRNSTSKVVSGVQNSELYKDRINMAADTHNKAALEQAQARRERLLEQGRSTKGVDREIQRLARRRLQFDKEGVDRDMATNPSRLAAAQAAIRNQARENEIQGYMAQISGNQFEDSKGHIVNGSSPDAVRDALMAEMALPEEEQSYAKQAALYRTLENKGKPGLKAMREILDSPIAYSDANRQTISDMVNNNALKDQYKSAHEVAKNIQNNMQAAYTSATNENKDKKPGEPLANPADKYATSSTAGKAGMVKARLDSGEDNAQIKYDEISNLHKDQLQSYLESSYTDPALSEALDRSLSSPDSNYNADQLQTIYNGRAENIANHIDEKFNASPSTQIESTNAIDAAKLIGSSESRSYVSEATTDKVINSLQNYQNRKGGAPIDTELISGGWTKGPDPHTLTNGGSYIYHTDTGTFEKKAK